MNSCVIYNIVQPDSSIDLRFISCVQGTLLTRWLNSLWAYTIFDRSLFPDEDFSLRFSSSRSWFHFSILLFHCSQTFEAKMYHKWIINVHFTTIIFASNKNFNVKYRINVFKFSCLYLFIVSAFIVDFSIGHSQNILSRDAHYFSIDPIKKPSRSCTCTCPMLIIDASLHGGLIAATLLRTESCP